MKRTQRTSSVLFQNSHKFTRNQQRTNISFSLCVFALNIHLRTPPLSDRWANSAWTGGSWLWWTPDGWSPAGSRPPVLPPSVLLSSLLRLLLWWTEEAGARGCRWSWRTSDKSGRPIGWGTAGRWWCVADSANRRWRRRRQERRRAEIWATWGEKTWTTMIWHHSRHHLAFLEPEVTIFGRAGGAREERHTGHTSSSQFNTSGLFPETMLWVKLQCRVRSDGPVTTLLYVNRPATNKQTSWFDFNVMRMFKLSICCSVVFVLSSRTDTN